MVTSDTRGFPSSVKFMTAEEAKTFTRTYPKKRVKRGWFLGEGKEEAKEQAGEVKEDLREIGEYLKI